MCTLARPASTGAKPIAVYFIINFSQANDAADDFRFTPAETPAGFADGCAALARAAEKLAGGRANVADALAKLAGAAAKPARASAKLAEGRADRADAPTGLADTGAASADTPVKPADRCAQPDRNFDRAAATNEDG